MATCPNKSLQSWKDLVSNKGEDLAYYLWDKYSGEVPESEIYETAEFESADVEQPTVDQELSLYLSNKMNQNFNISNPDFSAGLSIDDIVTRHVPATQQDIDNKKEEC